ncbi:Ger(x)C family spore germination protein [Paenibacillus silviterrae]|uniref:Ger(x)C family spore germination protein n=1 Tax=Paenibacillus silviterrae TaxID=3242194 RepID=UPI0025437445|nr:Ger(x)C family spore germination protein [Paenibacillus chinjuensis]
MKRIACKLALCIILCGGLTGCGFKDIDKRFFAVSIAIDEPVNKERKYMVTIRLAIPSPEEKFGANNSILVTEENDSIAEALRIVKSKIDKELDLGHMKAIIIGESIAKKGEMQEICDWFFRRRDVQQIAWMGIGRPRAIDVIKLEPNTERLPSNMLFMFFGETGTETGYVVSEYMFDFRRRLTERGIDPILPVLEPRGGNQLTINRVALLDKKKQKLVLTPRETKIFNTFYQGTGKYDIRVNQGNDFFVIAAENVRSLFTIVPQADGKLKIKVRLKISGIIEETSKTHFRGDELHDLEKLAEQTVQERVQLFLKKLQQSGVDPIGFGLRYRAQNWDRQKAWDEWQELYPSVEFEVIPHVNITSTGVIS